MTLKTARRPVETNRGPTAAAAVAVALALSLGLAVAAAAQGTDPDLARGMRQVQEGYLDDAVATLDGVVRRLSGSPARQRDLAQAYLWLGIAHAQLDAEKAARASFREALRLDPTVALAEGWPPKVLRVFAAAQGDAGPAAPSLGPAATSGETAVQEFAARVEASIAAGDPSFLDGATDLDALLDKGMKGIDAPADVASAYRKNSKPGLRLGTALVDTVKNGGSYRFLRARRGPDGRPHALFRLILKSGGINYHEYALRGEGAKAGTATDVYIFTNGEWMSVTIRRDWLAVAAANGSTSWLKNMVGIESEYVKSIPAIRAIATLEEQGRSREALDALLNLPPSVQAHKPILLQRVYIAVNVGEREHAEAVEAFSRRFPEDAALNLLLVDFHFQKKQYDAALATLDRLGQAVGGDPHLDVLRGNLLYGKGDVRAAQAAFWKAVSGDPTSFAPYLALIDVAVAQKDHAETARLLTVVEKGGAGIPDLTTVPAYADFVRSDEYRTWMQSRKK
ncbi:MAG TPA: tetratricopeptide repeat protein [Vicinamibacteria bacterium]|nr:tetratricopeptide repeat protein [Vicinamibacteria bacterium]